MMNNIWAASLLAIFFVVAGALLMQFWVPLAYIGWLLGLAVVVLYGFNKYNRTK